MTPQMLQLTPQSSAYTVTLSGTISGHCIGSLCSHSPQHDNKCNTIKTKQNTQTQWIEKSMYQGSASINNRESFNLFSRHYMHSVSCILEQNGSGIIHLLICLFMTPMSFIHSYWGPVQTCSALSPSWSSSLFLSWSSCCPSSSSSSLRCCHPPSKQSPKRQVYIGAVPITHFVRSCHFFLDLAA